MADLRICHAPQSKVNATTGGKRAVWVGRVAKQRGRPV